MAEPLRRLRSELSGSGGKVARPFVISTSGLHPKALPALTGGAAITGPPLLPGRWSTCCPRRVGLGVPQAAPPRERGDLSTLTDRWRTGNPGPDLGAGPSGGQGSEARRRSPRPPRGEDPGLGDWLPWT